MYRRQVYGYSMEETDSVAARLKRELLNVKGVSEVNISRSDYPVSYTHLDVYKRQVHEQLDLLMNTDICNKYSFLEVYEAIMFTYIRGISTEKGAKVLEDFITEYRKQRIH